MKPLPAFLATLAALVSLAPAPPALAKLPPGTTFEACGQSGCTTASDQEALQLQLRLIEPTMEHSQVALAALSEEQGWFRVDLSVARADGGSEGRLPLGRLGRSFPVVFAPAARAIGVPRRNAHRWVPLSARQFDAYSELTRAVRPFPAEILADLDPATVARAQPAISARGDHAETTPTWLVAFLAALGPLVGLGVARSRGLRRRTAQGTPA